MNPRASLAIGAGRLAGAASRALGRGGGTAVAGVAALRIDPRLPRELAAQLGHGNAIVTGTNGKTTTARMLASIAREAGLRPLANASGSNLMRGVTASLLGEATLSGQIQDGHSRMGVFEIDEATLPEAAPALAPRAIVFTNLFRDQLDRYGEVDTVAALWRRAIGELAASTTLVLSADDPAVASLRSSAHGRVLTYGIDDVRAGGDELEHASDYRFCLHCGEELTYDVAFYGHVGHWRCGSCGNARPRPDIAATCIDTQPDGSMRLSVTTPADEQRIDLPLSGVYNVENALAAIAGAFALGLSPDGVERALASFRPAFGRQERFAIEGRDVVVLLGKNPTGMNQVLRLIAAGDEKASLLLFLNDGVADGRDISWIWDTDYELLASKAARVIVSGTRADELALRLKYADFAVEPRVIAGASTALDTALSATPAGETLYVVPTYTAMLEVRELLAKRGHRESFWEDG